MHVIFMIMTYINSCCVCVCVPACVRVCLFLSVCLSVCGGGGGGCCMGIGSNVFRNQVMVPWIRRAGASAINGKKKLLVLYEALRY